MANIAHYVRESVNELCMEKDKLQKENWTIPVELKATGLNPNKAAGQLSAGARAAAEILPGWINSKFVPVAVVKTANKQQLKNLRDPDKMIRFHGQSEYIRVIYCGDSLTEAM